MDTASSNTADKQRQEPPGKPFVKGDPRINRKGRPKSADALKSLIQSILHEAATKGADGEQIIIDGHVATNLEMMIRSMMKNPRHVEALLDRAYGKVPQALEHSGPGGGPVTMVIEYVNRRPTGDDPAGSATPDASADTGQ